MRAWDNVEVSALRTACLIAAVTVGGFWLASAFRHSRQINVALEQLLAAKRSAEMAQLQRDGYVTALETEVAELRRKVSASIEPQLPAGSTPERVTKVKAKGIVAASTQPGCPDLELSAEQETVESRTEAGNLVLGGVLNIWREKPAPRELIFTGVFAPRAAGSKADGTPGAGVLEVSSWEGPRSPPPPARGLSVAWGPAVLWGEGGRAGGLTVAPQWRTKRGHEIELPVTGVVGDTYAVSASLLFRR